MGVEVQMAVWAAGISVRIIAREGDEVAESVRRHRNDEREREVYLCVYFTKWLDASSDRQQWSVFLLPQRKVWPKGNLAYATSALKEP